MSEFGIRSITFSIDLDKIVKKGYQDTVAEKVKAVKSGISSEEIFVRTVRFNILPIKPDERLDKFLFLKKIQTLAEFSESIGIRWFNIAFNLIGVSNKETKVITSLAYDIVKKYKNSFINFIVADHEEINPFAALQCSQMILNASTLSSNGFDNFRVGVSLNPAENTPFFPFSYAKKDLSFSLACEITEPFIDILKNNPNDDINELRPKFESSLKSFGSMLDALAKKSAAEQEVNYGGMDVSLAPFPDDKVSVIQILHLLGLDDIGSNGTLFLTSYLTGILKSIFKGTDITPAGFNGVMYSLLEDHTMCESNNKKQLDIDKIIGYSTLCGCGLDMVPIPGNIIVEELASTILDVAVTSIKLKKPLGVRVLPIPGKDVNEMTTFDMDFLTNTRVMKMKNMSLNHKFFELNKYSV